MKFKKGDIVYHSKWYCTATVLSDEVENIGNLETQQVFMNNHAVPNYSNFSAITDLLFLYKGHTKLTKHRLGVK